MPVLLDGRLRREVIVIVLGIEFNTCPFGHLDDLVGTFSVGSVGGKRNSIRDAALSPGGKEWNVRDVSVTVARIKTKMRAGFVVGARKTEPV